MKNSKTITRNQLETLYRVMMKRMAKNYSAEKLSFLIGRPADYVTAVEMLESDPYSNDDLKCIALALKEKDVTSFFPLSDDDSPVNITMELECAGDKCTYSCAIIGADYKPQPYFSLQEDSAEGVKLQENNDYDSNIAKDAVVLLIKAGYFFESRVPVKVYQSINRFLKKTLSPTCIENALNSFCAGEDGALKKRQNAKNRFIYIEA